MSKWLSSRDVIGGGVLVLFSIWFYLTAQAIPTGNITGMPPSFFPSFLAVCLGVCSAFLLGKGIKDVLQGKKTVVSQTKDQKTVLILLGLLILYVVLFNIIGFIATTIIYLTCVMLLLKAGKLLKSVLISVVVTLVVYFIFGNLFNIPLP
ncbi:MAG: tripartite tricarboxylate transporter TctB family protein [Dehalobacterium sp.]